MVRVSEMVQSAELVEIGLPYDGESFRETSPAAAADRLESLRDAGYNVPQYAIDALREEADMLSPSMDTDS